MPVVQDSRSYDWGNTHRGGMRGGGETWSLKRWVVVSLLMTLLGHAVLFYVFRFLEVGESFRVLVEPQASEAPERFQINPELFREAKQLQPELDQQGQQGREVDLSALSPRDDGQSASDALEASKLREVQELADVRGFRGEMPSAMKSMRNQSWLGDGALGEVDLGVAVAEGRASFLKPRVSDRQWALSSEGMDADLSKDVLPEQALVRKVRSSMLGGGASKGSPEGVKSLDEVLGGGGKLKAGDEPLVMPSDVLFGYDSDQFGSEARVSLMKLALIVERNPKMRFRIIGHTDAFGDDAYNEDLSLRRAAAVKGWLVSSLRLKPEKFQVVGMGERKPLVGVLGDEEAQAPNRRVEIVAIES